QFVKLSDEGDAIDSIVQWQTLYDYDLLNNLTRFTDAQYNQKLFGYDALSRKVFNNDPNRGISHYTYDDAGNLIATRDAKQQTIRYKYDGLNRLTAEYYAANSDSADVRYHYDKPYGAIGKGKYWEADSLKVEATNTLGYLSWIADQTGEEHNAYDERGRVKWTVKRIGLDKHNRENYFTAFNYDPMDRVTNVAYPDASTVAYSYNSRGLLESVPNIIYRYDYNPAGQNALLQLACGTQTTYQYDHRLRLSKLKSLRLRDSLALQDLRYSFDEVSNITHITDARDTITLDSIGAELELPSLTARKYDASQSFIYDNLYRLTRAANNKIYGTIDYRYDRTGNMLRKDANLLEPNPLMGLGTMINGGDAGAWNRVGRTTNDVAGPNAITSTRGGMMTFRYDANGNMTKDEKARYHWDVKDRLKKVVKDSLQADYYYDYADSRKLKVVDDTIRAVYIDKLAEVRGEQLIKYYYAGMSRIAQVKTDTSYFLNDHLGSTSLSLNDTAKVVEQIVKHPYGLTRLAKNTGFSADYTFTGKERDVESDNFYFEARYYNVMMGRFVSVDPLITNSPLLQAYSYVNGNPLILVDLDGKQPTVMEGAKLSGHSYGSGDLPDGWEMVDGGELGLSKKFEFINDESGFQSALYRRKKEDGSFEYTYAFTGSQGIGVDWWKNNFPQALGMVAKQYEIAVKNAEILSAALGDTELTFTGHSLGGGLASAASLRTGRYGLTYNAAGLHNRTKKRLNLTKNATIDAYRVRGEIVGIEQAFFGLKAEGNIHLIGKISNLNERLRRVSPIFYLTDSVTRHKMGAIYKAIKDSNISE
ncbi:MAG: RHS repeat-associated core domain-containing protein, partial [Bacteroidota bacterium]